MNKAKVTTQEGTSILTIERTFDAPRNKVFKAFTDSTLIAKWWGITGNAQVEENDVRPGGTWRYVEVFEDKPVTFFGVFHAVIQDELLVNTSAWAELNQPAEVALDRTVFTEENGKTKVTITEVYFSPETLKAVIESGMEEGLQKSYDNLDKVLKTL